MYQFLECTITAYCLSLYCMIENRYRLKSSYSALCKSRSNENRKRKKKHPFAAEWWFIELNQYPMYFNFIPKIWKTIISIQIKNWGFFQVLECESKQILNIFSWTYLSGYVDGQFWMLMVQYTSYFFNSYNRPSNLVLLSLPESNL